MKLERGGYVYILTNAHHNVLYIGVTSNIEGRMAQHVSHFFKNSFSDKYSCEKLVYLEHFTTIEEAINREKQLKRWSRAKKEALINRLNPEWKDLLQEFY
jgi:putative endonuclease